ncbi:bone morphogenetic protein 4 isoform X2 [Eupeodes corollae]|nr:bone morphogenetic protein 4 isoform X2 [Eupeodes corollae]
MNPSLNDDNNEQLIKIIMDGLGLKKLPDYNKANISQLEYATKYNEYLERIRKRSIPDYDDILNQFDNDDHLNLSLSLLSILHNSSDTKIYRQRRSPNKFDNKNKNSATKSILLRFPLEISSDIKTSDIEEANIRLLLITSPALATSRKFKRRHSHNRKHRLSTKKKNFTTDHNENHNSTTSERIKENQESFNEMASKLNKSIEPSHFLNMKVYQLLDHKRKVWIDGRKIEVKFDRNKMDESTSQWLQFDVTKAVEEWLVYKKKNLGLEIQCDNCLRHGARIIDDLSGDSEEDDDDSGTLSKYDLAPVLNIIGRLGTHREKRSRHYHNQMTEKPKKKKNKSNCYKDNQRCCRHSMEVVFKEIKGFEFIIQPKVFDAGFCRGRCPPRYNPAHHHALLQSLIWKQDRKKVPHPCCAPSKLIELEVLHVDEKDNEKLKISTWTDMRVLECACS